MQTIHLQGIGKHPAIEAQELKVGDVTVWNYGGMNKITGVVKETASFITFELETRNGRATRRLKKTRLVGVCTEFENKSK